MNCEIRQGDALELLREMPDGSARVCVTSPPYWNLRDYQVDGQMGLERTPEAYLCAIVEVFAEVRRVLSRDGTLWLVMGDSYIAAPAGTDDRDHTHGAWLETRGKQGATAARRPSRRKRCAPSRRGDLRASRLKRKDLVGMPWRVALALQADGWWLRCDVIWNTAPESAKDRPTRAHDYVFLLSRSPRYYYNAAAIREPTTGGAHPRGKGVNPKAKHWAHGSGSHHPVAHSRRRARRPKQNESWSKASSGEVSTTRNRRSVWEIPTEPNRENHYAGFPRALVEPCILAGSEPGDVVLDPFCGTGTTGVVALQHGRGFAGIELNPDYCEMARRRIMGPLFAGDAQGGAA